MTTATDRADAVIRLEALARRGITVSICCAPRAGGACAWSVLASYADQFALCPTEFDTFPLTVAYVAFEALSRGWLDHHEQEY